MEALSIESTLARLTDLHARGSPGDSVDCELLCESFSSLSTLCSSSVVNQSTAASTNVAETITEALFKVLTAHKNDSSVTTVSLQVLQCGFVAITSLFAGNNAVTNQRTLQHCHRASTAQLTMDCLTMLLPQLSSKPVQGLLPSIRSTSTKATISIANEHTDTAANTQALLATTENALILLENLALSASIREQMGSNAGCELLVQILTQVAQRRAAIAEHCVAALSNLCCIDTTSTAHTAVTVPAEMSSILRIVHAGGCEAALAVLTQYASDVCVTDATLYLLQSLAAHSTEALQRVEQYHNTPVKPAKATNITNLKGTMSLHTMATTAVIANASRQTKSFTFGSTHKPKDTIDREAHGVIALLVRVLRIHCTNSITISEAAVSTLGSLVLQSPLLLLHLLGNTGIEILLLVLDQWGEASASIAAKCFRILTEMTEMTRRSRAELARVNAYFDSPTKTATVSNAGTHSIVQGRNSAVTSPGQSTSVSVVGSPSSSVVLPSVHNNKHNNMHSNMQNTDASNVHSDNEDSLFDCDDDGPTNLKIDIGIAGITSAQLYTVLDKVNICLLLMDAENGNLERELGKHAGAVAKKRVAMAAVSNIAIFAHKIKSFKGRKTSSKSDKVVLATDNLNAVSTVAGPADADSGGAGVGNDGDANNTSAVSPSLASLVLPQITTAATQSNNNNSTATPATSTQDKQEKSIAALSQALHRTTDMKHITLADTHTTSVIDQAASVSSLVDLDRTYEPVYVWVLRLIDTHHSIDVLHTALRLLLVVCNFNVYPYHWNQVAAALSGTGCAVLVKAFRIPELRSNSVNIVDTSTSDINIVYTSEMVVQTLHLLALCSAENREKLSHAGAHSIVVDLLHVHGEQSLVLCNTGAAVFVMLYDNISSKEANEGNAVACQTVLHLLQHYIDHMRFAETAFHMLKVLAAYTPNRRFLSINGGCAAIVTLLRHYTLQVGGTRNLAIAMLGLSTLASLAGLDDNESRIAKSGGCKLVVELCREYGFRYENAAAEGLSAVSVLAKHNRGMLGEVGACNIVSELLVHYNSGGLNEPIAHVAAMACFNLCLDYADNKKRFLPLNVIAKPLGKPDFLQVYKEAVLLTQLLFAPFGLADSTVDILGQQNALELYTSVFQQFEDLVSKRIFTIRGFEDDRIIASMHAFVGESQDEEVVREMQAATAALQNMLVSPRVIEFDFQHLPQDFSVVTARTAAILLNRVLAALIPTLYGKDSELIDCEFYVAGDAKKAMSPAQRTLFTIDTEILAAENIRIPTSAFSPTCCFSKAPFNSTSLRCGDSINALLVALSVPVSQLLSTEQSWLAPAQSAHTTTATTTECTVQFSLQQYHSLLDLYGSSEEVSEVLQHYIQLPTGPTGAPASIASVRSSLLLSSLNLSANPTVSYVNQLTSRLTALTKAAAATAAAAAASGTESKQPSEDEEFALIDAEDAVELAYHYIQSRTEAKQCEQAQQYSKARELLTEGLLDLIGKDQQDQQDQGEKTSGVHSDEESEGTVVVLLPVHMRVILLTERASYTRICGDLQEALADVSRAIALDNQYAPAYSLRSKIRLQVIQEREEAEGHDDGEGAGAKESKAAERHLTDAQKADALHLAAEDALLAFLLDGSSDLALAGAAEEACREAVRLSAKSIFQDRRSTTSAAAAADARKDNLPRSWLVGSYFGAYQQLSTALSLYASDAPAAVEAGASESSSEVECSDNLHDIDDDTAVTALPAPPKHLLDTVPSTVSATPVTVDGTADSTADSSEAPAEVPVAQEKDKDREAYALLLCLTELVETVTYDSKVNALSSNVPTQGLPTPTTSAVVHVTPIEHITTVRQRDTVTVNTATGHKKTHRSVAASLLAFAEEAGVQSLAQVMGGLVLDHANKSETDGEIETHRDLVFIEGGVLTEKTEETAIEATPVPAEAPVSVSASAATDDVPEVKVEPCKHYRAALSLLRGAGLGDLQNSGVVLGLPAHLLTALQSMDADTLLALTGVRFNADGSVDHIVPAPLPAGTVAATADQADGDAQSESSRSERSYEYNDGEHEHDAHTGGGHGFHFDGAGMYGAFADAFGEMYEDMEEGSDEDGSYYQDEEDESQDDSQEESEEQSDWETMSGSEATGTRDSMTSEASAASEELPPPKHAAPHKNTKAAAGKAAGKTSAPGRGAHASYVKPPTGRAPAREATKATAAGSASTAKESREAEVNAALRAVGEQMLAHHLEDFEEEVPPSPPASPTAAASTARDVPAVRAVPVVEPVHSDAQALPPPPPVALAAVAPGVAAPAPAPTETDGFEPEMPPSPPASPSAAVGKSAATTMDIPVTTASPEPPAAPIDVSHRLRARLLNLCGSIAYLAGDATGAVQCFRASIQQDPALLDSQVKLGSLLVDMDEMKEAAKLLKGAHKKCPSDFIALLHLAELHTHENNFDEAVHLLRKARRLSETALAEQSDTAGADNTLHSAASLRAALLTGTSNSTTSAPTTSTSTPAAQAEVQAFLHRAQRAQEETLANIISLLGINLFRQLPARPEVALHLLQGALSSQFKDKHCPILLLCCGEVYSQAGDMVTALECFSKAHASAPNNPLSYVNAARTYQQLNQVHTAEKHLQAALLLDPAMAMVRVDLAQNLLLSGSAAQALVILDQALALARQVSEIRDVLTARTIAAMQVSLEERGLYCSSGMRSISH